MHWGLEDMRDWGRTWDLHLQRQGGPWPGQKGMVDPNRRLEDMQVCEAEAVAPVGHADGCC